MSQIQLKSSTNEVALPETREIVPLQISKQGMIFPLQTLPIEQA